MLFLVLAVLSSAGTALTMRVGGSYIKSKMAMFSFNYLACLLLALYYTGVNNLFVPSMDMASTVVQGIAGGALYLISFTFMQWNISKNGMVLSSTFMRLGVIVPTIMAIIVFREKAKLTQVIGIALALIAIIIINFDKADGENTAKFGLQRLMLILLLVCGGLTDSMANIYDKTTTGELRDHYLLVIFLSAMIFAIIMWVKEGMKICKWDVIFGIILGVPNYFSARFLLWALGSLPAVIVYPAYSVSTIVVVTIISRLIFGEKISNLKKIALGAIFVALVLLNL